LNLPNSKPARATFDGGSDWFDEEWWLWCIDRISGQYPEGAGSTPVGHPTSLLTYRHFLQSATVKTKTPSPWQVTAGEVQQIANRRGNPLLCFCAGFLM
jgi:hypothetical protein